MNAIVDQMAGYEMPVPVKITRHSPGAKAFYVLALLCLISLLGYYDRYLVAILVQDIKHDLKVSDGEIGLLTGFAFAFVYSLFAVPVARFSDRGRRVLTLGLSLVLWSAMTVLCGIAPSFTVLLIARLGVGMGEAGGIPTTHALVSEYFPGKWRSTALAATVVVGGVGFMIANAVGGAIADRWGWRTAFLVGSAPAPVLALLLFATVREPAVRADTFRQSGAGMGQAIAVLLKRRSFALLCAGVAVTTVASAAMLNWIPAFLMRQYGLTAGQVGSTYGVILGLSTIAALLIGGLLGDVLGRRDPRWGIRLPALSFALAGPFTMVFLLSHSLPAALIMAAPMTFLCSFGVTPAYALVQRLAGPHYRATATALYLLIVNLFGMGSGPAIAGFLSDRLALLTGHDSLKYALLIVATAYVAGGALIALGSRFLSRDCRVAEMSAQTD